MKTGHMPVSMNMSYLKSNLQNCHYIFPLGDKTVNPTLESLCVARRTTSLLSHIQFKLTSMNVFQLSKKCANHIWRDLGSREDVEVLYSQPNP